MVSFFHDFPLVKDNNPFSQSGNTDAVSHEYNRFVPCQLQVFTEDLRFRQGIQVAGGFI